MTALLTEQPIDNRQSSIDNPQFDRAIIALLTQPSIAEAARACDLGESTLRRWLHQPDFAHAYSQARQQAFSVALGSLQNLSEQAVQTLQSLMQDPQISPSVRLSAARTILQMSFKAAQQCTLQARLDQLENAATSLESEQEDCRPMRQSPIDNRHGQEEEASLNRSHSVKSARLATNGSPFPCRGEVSSPACERVGAEPGEEQACSPLLAKNEQTGEGSAGHRKPKVRNRKLTWWNRNGLGRN